MEKIKISLVLFISFVLIFSIYQFSQMVLGDFVGFSSPYGDFKWWNTSWHYRTRLEINSTQYNRTDWPLEQMINFTELIPNGTFDENSTRIFEYDLSGSILYEIPSQFDKEESFNSSTNALGTLAFLMNGTTQADSKRIFYVYYDTIENGAKQSTNYTSDFSYNFISDEVSVNNSLLNFWIDTQRGENTSGISRVIDVVSGQDVLKWFPPLADDARTYEYSQLSNGTYNFSFNLANNATFKYVGPVRIVVEQKGSEVLWNSTNLTDGFIVKRYTFYKNNKWIKVEINFTNIGSNNITRNSTFAGAITLDANRTFNWGSGVHSEFGNTSYPAWWYYSDFQNDYQAGIININQNGTTNFWLPNCSSTDRIGIQLNSTTISPGSSIIETALFRFSYQEDYPLTRDLRNRFANPININQSLPERWYVIISPSTNATVYNRNETVLIIGNVSANDPYNLTEYMNATLDMGTTSSADDQTIILYDDGTHGDTALDDKAFTNIFNVSNSDSIGLWNINFTSYSNDSELLNLTNFSFNVTDVLNVTVNVTNKKPLVDSVLNATIYVKNYRMDSWISESTINCTYNSSEVINKTDYGNGTYSINFTTPSQEGNYILYCNATKNGNLGNNSDEFTAETAKTNISIPSLPQIPSVSNISLYQNDSFSIEINATNFANGTAYSSNISLELLQGWDTNSTLENCGNIEKNSYCLKSFNVTVPNGTSPENYYINATISWRNPDGTASSNKTQVNVTVLSNPKISVLEEALSSEVGDGIWNAIGNFTVLSVGNDQITNVSFSCYSGTICNDFSLNFTPENISSISSGSNQSVLISISIPLGYSYGIYSGFVNVSAQNDNLDTFIINVTVPRDTNVSITSNISNYTANNITQQSSEIFGFEAYATNIENSSARFVNISLSIPSGWTSNSSLEYCGNLTKNNTCSKSFNVTIPNGTLAGNYSVNISTNWTNNNNSLGINTTSINVTVSSNPSLNISEINVSGNVSDGTTTKIGNFTIFSIGNDALQNVTFNCYQGTVCQNFSTNFTPTNISSLDVNSNQTVNISIDVPLGFTAGTYDGTINVSAENGNYKNLTISVTVPSNRTWTISQTSCTKSEYPDEGTACEINVKNVGNDIINFTISPQNGNYTTVNVTSFYVNAATNYTFNITYNVTNVTQASYNSIFTLSAIQSDSNPTNRTINVTLLPYLPPSISFDIIPNSTEQNSSIEVFANVTDLSGGGISLVNISITRPDGASDQSNMTFISQNGSISQWYFKYADSIGNTTQRGFYNVTVSAQDNIGNFGNLTKNFSIYVKMLVSSSTLSSIYLQGDIGSIYYTAKNMSGYGINNINVTFTIINPTGNISYRTEQVTNSEGTISPMPSFTIPTDSVTGNYTLMSNATYYDNIVNITVNEQKNITFQVNSRTITVTGLFADIETAVVWYPNNTMRIGVLIYNGEGRPTDPTGMNLTVYDSDNNLYFSVNMSQMTKLATGYYMYQKTLSEVIPSGMYLAVLNVTQNEFQTMKLKAFRVAHGGPYDVRINLFENEVPQGDYLDFAIVIENKGEVRQDVFVQYWVSSQNTTYYTNNEAVLTPELSNQSFTRSAYIYSTQPLGTYTLNAKIIYDNVQSPIYANTTFMVVTKTTPPTPNITPVTPSTTYVYLSPTGGTFSITHPSEKISSSILISNYNNNISLARNLTKIESVTVKNTGKEDLKNVSIFILGIPLDWFKIIPESYEVLSPGNSSVFLVEFTIPKNANTDEYKANLIATSGIVSDQKPITLTVYQSLEELLKNSIKKYREDLQDLYIDIKVAEREGKDVSTVLSFYNETKSKVDGAEIDLGNNKIEDALSKISGVPNLIKRARDLLNNLEVTRGEGFAAPIWMVFIIFIVILGLTISIVFVVKKKKRVKIRPYVISLGRIADIVKKKKVSKEEIDIEKEKLTRMLKVLDKEKEEGIITGSSYDKMKKSIEEKLVKLENK